MQLMTMTLHQSACRPGELLTGVVEWELDTEPGRLNLTLLYYTDSRAGDAPQLIEEQTIDAPGIAGRCEFQFILPDGPPSFTGKLIQLKWAVELTATGFKTFERQEFTLTPTGQPIELPRETRHLSAVESRG